jgi:hypothetical protein
MIGDNFTAGDDRFGTILDYDTTQLAEKLVLLDQDIFRNISGRECLNDNFEGTKGEQKSPYIFQMRSMFDKIKRWVLTELVKASDIVVRGKVLAHLVSIAEV